MSINEAVFISDLHLHPNMPEIAKRFDEFLSWASKHTEKLYILGDFFHVWAGDDTANAWSDDILAKLNTLYQSGIQIYFMPGNRDFLVGEHYLKQSGVHILAEPTVLNFGDMRVLLTHGDQYCTQDKAHQWFRFFTRNTWFTKSFLRVPKWLRLWITQGVRKRSEGKLRKSRKMIEPIPNAWIKDLQFKQAEVVVHGHTHHPKHEVYTLKEGTYQQFVLSDWDAAPTFLCYNKSKGFYFNH